MKCRRPSVDLVEKWIEQGDGQGERENYRPFLKVRDVPSKGRSSIVHGLRTGRTHHYLSDIEYYHHILSEFSPGVIDIREQYALLPWGETQDIAKELGFKHPIYPGTSTPTVMTSDIVLTTSQGKFAVLSIKGASDLEKTNPSLERTLQKLRIEQEYWRRRNIPWKLSTENDISIVKAKNLAMLRTSMVSRELDWIMPHIDEFVALFVGKWHPEKKLRQILTEVVALIGLTTQECFCLFGRAVWLHRLHIDLGFQIDHFSNVKMVWN